MSTLRQKQGKVPEEDIQSSVLISYEERGWSRRECFLSIEKRSKNERFVSNGFIGLIFKTGIFLRFFIRIF